MYVFYGMCVCGYIRVCTFPLCSYCFPCLNRLSSDGKRTFLVNFDSDILKPEGWDNLANEKPEILSFSDISIYELHIRDFRCELDFYCAYNFFIACYFQTCKWSLLGLSFRLFSDGGM